MNDFFDSLKDIKKQMQADAPKSASAPKKNPNRDEFKDIFVSEEPSEKEQRLRDEFAEFVNFAGVVKKY